MQCPIHKEELIDVSVGKTSLNHCNTCSGLWISSDAQKLLFEHRKLNIPTLNTDALMKSCSYSTRVECPVDGTRTIIYIHRGVEIDICVSCGGIWFDCGELEKILNITQKTWKQFLTEAGFEVAVNAAPDLVLHASESAVEAGSIIIEFIIEAIFSI